MSDPISRQYASVRIHDVLSPFRTSSSTAQITAAVQETLTFINLFLPSDVENQPAFFISQLSHYDSDERMELHDQAVAAAEEMSEWLEKCEARNLNSVSCKSLFAAMGVEHRMKIAEQRMYLHFRLDTSIGEWLQAPSCSISLTCSPHQPLSSSLTSPPSEIDCSWVHATLPGPSRQMPESCSSAFGIGQD